MRHRAAPTSPPAASRAPANRPDKRGGASRGGPGTGAETGRSGPGRAVAGRPWGRGARVRDPRGIPRSRLGGPQSDSGAGPHFPGRARPPCRRGGAEASLEGAGRARPQLGLGLRGFYVGVAADVWGEALTQVYLIPTEARKPSGFSSVTFPLFAHLCNHHQINRTCQYPPKIPSASSQSTFPHGTPGPQA